MPPDTMPPESLSKLRPPSALFGALFDRVQSESLFTDSKTFPDLIPLESPEIILDHYRRAGALDREQLSRFVETHFRSSPEAPLSIRRPKQDLVGRIQELWATFVRQPAPEAPYSSLIETAHAYVVPGGRFRETYYWDSYFSILGLVVDGQQAEAADITRGFAALIERFGFIPNGTRSYYLGRSQPPLFYLMAELGESTGSDVDYLALLVREHAFWMSGAEGLAPGQAHRRAVTLPDGAVLNRYWDDVAGPRDEAYAEDRSLVNADGRPEEELFRDLRAGAESGWDFSSRWLDDPSDLGSIRTTAILPIDLNAFLWGLETAIRKRYAAAGDQASAQTYGEIADRRAHAIRTWLWDAGAGIFCDYDWRRGARLAGPTAALLIPLFVGLAQPSEAESAAAVVQARLLRAGGLVTSEIASGQQWDAPNGWAPLQWMAVMGLANFGHVDLAETIADRWLAMVSEVFDQTGRLFEKYDVESRAAGGGGEYAPQDGFGWTNGVTRALMQWRAGQLSRLSP